MGRKKKSPGAFSPKTREIVMMAIARKAAAGNMAAARIYLDEYRALGTADVDAWNERMISLADLINNPAPDRTIDDLTKEGD